MPGTIASLFLAANCMRHALIASSSSLVPVAICSQLGLGEGRVQLSQRLHTSERSRVAGIFRLR